jgi:hypothetical protein
VFSQRKERDVENIELTASCKYSWLEVPRFQKISLTFLSSRTGPLTEFVHPPSLARLRTARGYQTPTTLRSGLSMETSQRLATESAQIPMQMRHVNAHFFQITQIINLASQRRVIVKPADCLPWVINLKVVGPVYS